MRLTLYANAFTLYLVKDGDWLAYLGIAPVATLHQFRDMPPELTKTETMMLTILGTYETFTACYVAFNAAHSVLQPSYSYVHKPGTETASRAVICVDTSVKHASASACAKANGLNQSNLSKHLNNPTKYKTIGGKVYKWI